MAIYVGFAGNSVSTSPDNLVRDIIEILNDLQEGSIN